MGSELRVAIWESGTPEYFLNQLCDMVHAMEEINLEMKFKKHIIFIEAWKLGCKMQ